MAIAVSEDAEDAGEVGGLTEEFGGLAGGGAEEDGEGVGVAISEMVGDEGGGSGGLAPLAGAIEDEAGLGKAEDLGLGRVGMEVEASGRKGGGVAIVPEWSEG